MSRPIVESEFEAAAAASSSSGSPMQAAASRRLSSPKPGVEAAEYDVEAACEVSRETISTSCSEASNPNNSASAGASTSGSPAADEEWQAVAVASAGTEDDSVGRGRGCGGRRACRLSCCAAAAALLSLLLVLLLPRDPEWQVKKLAVPPGELSSIVAAFTSPNASTTTVRMDATAAFWNPNFLGADASAGSFIVSWEGHELSRVTSEPMAVAGRSVSQTTAHAVSVITPAVSKLLMAEVQRTNFRLQVAVRGRLPASVPLLFGLRVNVALDCTVDVNVLMLMSDPDKLVAGHACTYRASF